MSFHSFPGIDLGYNINSNFKLYSNIGKTFRVPTYTDLYYSDRTTIGNENLNPESATSTELGFKYNTSNFKISGAFFNRKAKNIIDYVKENENDLWNAVNIGSLKTTGFELDFRYNFQNQNYLNLGYTNINDNSYVTNINYSKNMIGILGGMGTQAGLDFCNKLAVLNRGKIDQEYPLFILYNKSNIPGRPESIGVQTKNLSNRSSNNTSKKKYQNVLKSLLQGCRLLEKNKCKFIVIPCNTAHYWFDDLQKKINIPIINMPKEVFKFTKKNCKKNSKVGLLATEGTLKTGVYDKIFNKDYDLIQPSQSLQKKSVNKAIKLVKMGNVKAAAKAIQPAINELIKMKCKKIILGCTELPIAIFAFKSFNNVRSSKIFLDPNLILANSAMAKHKR